MDAQGSRILYRVASVESVSTVTKLLIAFAAADHEELNRGSVLLPRNELIFEGIKFGLQAV
jgi:hypothetical protein